LKKSLKNTANKAYSQSNKSYLYSVQTDNFSVKNTIIKYLLIFFSI